MNRSATSRTQQAAGDGRSGQGLIEPVAKHERDHHADRGRARLLTDAVMAVIRLRSRADRLRWLTSDGMKPNAASRKMAVTYWEQGRSGRQARPMLAETALRARSAKVDTGFAFDRALLLVSA